MLKYNIVVALQLALNCEAFYRPLMKYCILLVWWAAALVVASGCVARKAMNCFLHMYSMRYLLSINMQNIDSRAR